jgi:hypothetical protein
MLLVLEVSRIRLRIGGTVFHIATYLLLFSDDSNTSTGTFPVKFASLFCKTLRVSH